ncbi:uncharacterized protein [Procambarus clarkii]|uniref:uncharacterized protein n=1 Tax=Procambarus clarkii TaxID=6728 RepID=UPI003741EA9F
MKLRLRADRFTANDKEVCEKLNKKLLEVFTLEQGEVPEISEGIVNQEPLEKFELNSGEVKKLMLELDVTKAIGPVRFSPWKLKEGAEALCLPLSIVYNKSLVTEKLPRIWKVANAIPIYKKGDREALNYWSVSLTCVPCMLMEKIVRKKLVKHLERKNFVTKNQHGFRDGKSCLAD